MAQQKELKSAFGQSPTDLQNSGVATADEDFSAFDVPYDEASEIIPPGTAIPGTARGLPEQPQQQFVGPYAPEFYQGGSVAERMQPVGQLFGAPPQYAGGGEAIEADTPYTGQQLSELLSAGQMATDIGIGMAFPAASALKIGTIAGLTQFAFDTLKNQVNTDANQISTPQKLFNSVFSGLVSGASQKATQFLLGNIIKRASAGNESAILDAAKEEMKQRYGEESVQALVEQAEKTGAKLSPAEAFPFDPNAQAVTAEALKEHPGLGIQLSNRIGQYKQAVRNLFFDSKKIGSGNLREFADESIERYHTDMGRIQKELNRLGADVDVRMDAKSLEDLVKSEMDKVNVKLEGDLLAGSVDNVPRMAAIFTNLRNKIKAASLPSGSKVVGLDGKAVTGKAQEAMKLTLNDIESFRKEISDLVKSAYEKNARGIALSEDEVIAKRLYGGVAKIRDEMSERVANQVGRPELAKEVSRLRGEYTQKIEALELVRDRLSKAPADELKYLFNKNNADEAQQIISLLSPGQRVSLKETFVNRLIDPVYHREAGIEASDRTLAFAKKQLESYDPGVLSAIYSKDELATISRFLELGSRAETVLSKAKLSADKVGVARKFAQMVMDPVNKVLLPILDLMDSRSPLKQFADYRLFLAGNREAGRVSPEVAARLGAGPKTAGETAKGVLKAIPAGIEKAVSFLPESAQRETPRVVQGAVQYFRPRPGQE